MCKLTIGAWELSWGHEDGGRRVDVRCGPTSNVGHRHSEVMFVPQQSKITENSVAEKKM